MTTVPVRPAVLRRIKRLLTEERDVVLSCNALADETGAPVRETLDGPARQLVRRIERSIGEIDDAMARAMR